MLTSKAIIKNGRVKTKDTKITITIENDEPINESEETIPDDLEYKGYEIKQDNETGEFDIYSLGGAVVAHAATLELAKNFVDNVDVGI